MDPPRVFQWSIVAYGFTSTLVLLTAMFVGLVVGLGLDGLGQGQGFLAGLASPALHGSDAFAIAVLLLVAVCFGAAGHRVWCEASHARGLHTGVAAAFSYLAIRLLAPWVTG